MGPRNMTAIGLKCKPSTGLTQYHSVTYEKLSNKNMAIYYKKTLRMNSILAIDKNDIYRHGIILRQLLDKTLYTKSRVENNEYLKMIYTEIIICGKIPVCFANCGKIEFFDLSEYFNFDEALVDTQYNCENHMDSLQYTANENDTSEEEDDQMYHGNFETQEELIKSKQTKKSPITVSNKGYTNEIKLKLPTEELSVIEEEEIGKFDNFNKKENKERLLKAPHTPSPTKPKKLRKISEENRKNIEKEGKRNRKL